MMTIEFISDLVAVLAIGFGLAGLILASWRGVRHEMRDMRTHMGRIDSHIAELRERMDHVEGLLQGLREAFTPRQEGRHPCRPLDRRHFGTDWRGDC